MYRIFTLFLLFIQVAVANAQKENFIYLQQDDKQPFYVRMNDKTFSSSESGYLILSKIKDSTISFTVGFAKNAFPEQFFTIKVDKKDVGFLLKNMGDKGWALFNLQTLELISATPKKDNNAAQLSGDRKTDAFSVMLSNVVNDSIILYANNQPPVASKEPISVATVAEPPLTIKKKDTATAVLVDIKQDTVIAKKSQPVSDTVALVAAPPIIKKDTIALEQAPPEKSVIVASVPIAQNATTKTVIKQISSSVNKQQYTALFAVATNGITDTVDVLIPFEEVAITAPAKVDVVNLTNCPNIAGDNDVDKLRIQLLGANNNVDKIAISRKTFQSKCFSTKQLKALTELFDDEQGKYLFYESAYPHTTDVENFPSLKTSFQSNFFTSKFNQLISK